MMFNWFSFYLFCASHGQRGLQYFDNYLDFWSCCGFGGHNISAYKF